MVARKFARKAAPAVVEAEVAEIAEVAAVEAPVVEEAPSEEAPAEEVPAEIAVAKIKEVATINPNRIAPNNSAGVAKSWENPDVAASRSKRHLVTVDGQPRGSARKAFMELYPQASTAARQKFRKELVAAGKLRDTQGRIWEVIA